MQSSTIIRTMQPPRCLAATTGNASSHSYSFQHTHIVVCTEITINSFSLLYSFFLLFLSIYLSHLFTNLAWLFLLLDNSIFTWVYLFSTILHLIFFIIVPVEWRGRTKMQKWSTDILGHDIIRADSDAYDLPIAERVCRGSSNWCSDTCHLLCLTLIRSSPIFYLLDSPSALCCSHFSINQLLGVCVPPCKSRSL